MQGLQLDGGTVPFSYQSPLSCQVSQVISSKQPKHGLTQELSFSRIGVSTTGYTFTPCVGHFTSLAYTSDRRDHRLLVCCERNCLSIDTAVGGTEPPSPRLTVRRSIAARICFAIRKVYKSDPTF